MQVQSPSFRLLGPSSRPPKNFDLPMHCDVINFLTILLNFPSFFFSSLTLLRHSLYMPTVFIRVLDKMRGGDDKYHIPLPIGTGPLPPEPPHPAEAHTVGTPMFFDTFYTSNIPTSIFQCPFHMTQINIHLYLGKLHVVSIPR